ncbi:hypothetical protein ACF046_03085 [Glutamicibacter creatinolyticus]|uniref:hypothetical protein n=1 Tax=Glutamicibacter creatinolyticus TaxID=162496 RepID=UPI0033C2ADAB
MSDLSSQQSTGPASQPSRSRRPKSDEELLAESERRVRSLKAKITGARDKRRSELVEDLYARYGIDQQPGDLGEAKRISLLRGRVDL